MRLATIKLHGAEVAGIVARKGIVPVAALNAAKGTGWKEDMMSLIQVGHIPGLTNWYNNGSGSRNGVRAKAGCSARNASVMDSTKARNFFIFYFSFCIFLSYASVGWRFAKNLTYTTIPTSRTKPIRSVTVPLMIMHRAQASVTMRIGQLSLVSRNMP